MPDNRWKHSEARTQKKKKKKITLLLSKILTLWQPY